VEQPGLARVDRGEVGRVDERHHRHTVAAEHAVHLATARVGLLVERLEGEGGGVVRRHQLQVADAEGGGRHVRGGVEQLVGGHRESSVETEWCRVNRS